MYIPEEGILHIKLVVYCFLRIFLFIAWRCAAPPKRSLMLLELFLLEPLRYFISQPTSAYKLTASFYSNRRWSFSEQPADTWLFFLDISDDIGEIFFRWILWIVPCCPRTPLLILQRYITSLKPVIVIAPSRSFWYRRVSFLNWSL
jgi:hypothetical protein